MRCKFLQFSAALQYRRLQISNDSITIFYSIRFDTMKCSSFSIFRCEFFLCKHYDSRSVFSRIFYLSQLKTKPLSWFLYVRFVLVDQNSAATFYFSINATALIDSKDQWWDCKSNRLNNTCVRFDGCNRRERILYFDLKPSFVWHFSVPLNSSEVSYK